MKKSILDNCRSRAAIKEFGLFTTEDTEFTEERTRIGFLINLPSLRLHLRALRGLCGEFSEKIHRSLRNFDYAEAGEKEIDNSGGFLGKWLEIVTAILLTELRYRTPEPFYRKSKIMSHAPTTFEEWWVGSYYRRFVEREGVPLYEGSILEDLATLPLGDWGRRGGKAAYTRLGDQEEVNLQIVEIPPKGELKPEHHMYESIMYVMKGNGATTIWQEGEPKKTVEWKEGALLAIPLNAWHQEFNGSGDEPCRILFGTNMAQVINLYHNLEFVFNNPFKFTDRYSHSMENFYADEGKHWNLRLFATNFIPDIRTFQLDRWEERGIRTFITRLYMGNSLSQLHILEVSEGTYVTAHRHNPGAHVVVVDGGGYELMFQPGDELKPEKRQKVFIKPYSVVAPGAREFHQHFNTAKGPLRQLAFKGWVRRPLGTNSKGEYDSVGAARSDDPAGASFKIRYDKEDPKIREEYYRELEKNGVSLRLEPVDQGG